MTDIIINGGWVLAALVVGLVSIEFIERAINQIVSCSVQVNREVRESIVSGDLGQFDAEVTDCIAQIAAFEEIVYG